MIINEAKRDISSTVQGETSQFSIAVTGKAFDILVSGIYSDKIQSVIRELMSNAHDAHVNLGNLDTPFEVGLPNALNPTFLVRDFGCSMTHEFVMSEYSTLFSSSKSGNNDETGCLGLGSKAFLAVTDFCVLRCWMNGETRVYQIGLNPVGVPTVTMVHRGPSSEPRGTEVSFAVSPQDFSAYVTAYQEVALGFDTPPKVKGVEVSVPVPSSVGNGWRMFRNGVSTNRVRQGCATYPLPNSIRTNLPYEHKIIIDVPLGAVSFTASREALSLSNHERNELQTMMDVVREEIRDRHIAEYKALHTDLERAHYAHTNAAILADSIAYPAWVKLPFSLLQNKSGNPFDVFNIASLSKVYLILDDGSKVVRRVKRLKALESWSTPYVVTDKAQFDEAIRLLGLHADRAKVISEIPDVHVSPRSPSAARPKKDVSIGRIWTIAERGVAQARIGDGKLIAEWNIKESATARSSRSRYRYGHVESRGTGLFGLVGDAWIVSEVLNGEEVLYLTPLQAEAALAKGKICMERNLATVLREHMSDDDFIAPIRDRCIKDNINCSSQPQHIFITRLGLKPERSDDKVRLFGKMFPEKVEEFNLRGADVNTALAEKYPLLFSENSSSIRGYIDLCDAGGSLVAVGSANDDDDDED